MRLSVLSSPTRLFLPAIDNHTVALGENVVAITSSLPCAAQGLSHALSSSSANILPIILTHEEICL